MNNMELFWADVAAQAAIICAEVSKRPKQFKLGGVRIGKDLNNKNVYDGAVYITSLNSRMHGTSAGVTVMAPLKLAAQRITEGTHELSSDAAIDTYLAEEAKRKAEYEGRTAEAKRSVSLNVSTVKA